MNSLLQVKLRFSNEGNPNKPVGRNLRSSAETSSDKIRSLIDSLKAVLLYYRSVPSIFEKVLIDVNYNDIIAKTNRIQELLKPPGKSTNDVVVGARFSDATPGEENHIITYYVERSIIEETISELEVAARFVTDRLDGKATPENFNLPKNKHSIVYDGYGVSKSKLRNIIVDCSVIDSFSVPAISSVPEHDTYLITFYKTELTLSDLLQKINADTYQYNAYGSDTISATRDLFEYIKDRIPYAISMISSDLSQLSSAVLSEAPDLPAVHLPSPSNEPTIGVIDTLFDTRSYFSEWVENTDYLDELEKYQLPTAERIHGTQVDSIIVDGPRMNPWLDDGCGRFKVRHFGVCISRISVSRLVRKIKEIIQNNLDIHVWNLSLGTEDEVSRNFISFDAAVLDEIQAQFNVIFVVSGTNDNRVHPTDYLRVGSPADSLNSIIVNSVRRNQQPASYSRKGNILSFFNKPDVSYYGGDYDERIQVYSVENGEEDVFGTSFAAPWISRKLCYLIDVLGFSREIAKALIIDSAAGWNYKTETIKQKDLVGYGTVPINISDIVNSNNDEIRFIVYGTSESYRTANYGIPVPKDEDDKYPYIARATLCYFPECTRTQGVDYTNRELSLRFGRIDADGKINDINENTQDDEGSRVDERQSRSEFRKWENVKFISKIMKQNRPLKSYDERLWGLTVTSKERLSSRTGRHLNFGIVITLKELSGVNRIQDFIRACTIRGWIVNEINIENQINVYNTSQEEIIFD